MALLVDFSRNLPKSPAAAAQLANGRNCRLFALVALHVYAVGRQAVSVAYIANALTLAAFVRHCVAGALTDASRSHWLTAAMIVITIRRAAEPVSMPEEIDVLPLECWCACFIQQIAPETQQRADS